MTRTLDLLDHLVAFKTVSDASNLGLIDWADGTLRAAGCSTARLPSPCGRKAGLHARIGPDAPGGICLSAHTDVVPVAGQDWTTDPFRLTRGGARVYGRGTTDMKGFVASALALAERAGAAKLAEPLTLVLSYDEEVGCVGIRDMLPALAPLLGQPKLVIVGEPTSMRIGVGHKGKTALKVHCKGDAGHSALAPRFLNAIHVASHFVSEVQKLQAELSTGLQNPSYDLPYTTVHIGKITGGQALNMVPELVTLDMEFRSVAPTAAKDVMQAIHAAAGRTETRFDRPDLIEIEQTNAYPGLAADSGASAMRLAAGLAETAASIHVDFGTEAGYFASLGLNTVVIGPGDMASDGHRPDEALDIAQIDACDTMMDRILRHLI